MIITVTPNPSLDRTYHVDEFRLGELHRANHVGVEASGKGVNVSRVLAALGVPTVAVIPVGGRAGHDLAALLGATGLPCRAVRVAGAARVNVTVIEPGGRTTKVNEPGEPLTAAELDELVRQARTAAVEHEAAWVACCGSLPPGAGPELVARLVDAAHAAGARAAVDTSGAALPAALAAGADLVKPNREELAELAGRPLPGLADVAAAAREIAAGGVTVLASAGSDGAVLVAGPRSLWAAAPPIRPVNTTGAGDTLLAGYLAGLAAREAGGPAGDLAGCLAEAVALGTSACLVPGTAELPGRLIPAAEVTVRRIDTDGVEPGGARLDIGGVG